MYVLHSIRTRKRTMLTALAVVVLFIAPASMLAAPKKKGKKGVEPDKPPVNWLEKIDTSKIVWPAPPAIARVRYRTYYAGEKFDPNAGAVKEKKKARWMDRLAGTQTDEERQQVKPRFVLVQPYGLAVDSKNRIFVADTKVGAIFIFDSENKEDVQLIKNGTDAHFGRIVGLAIDDGDRLYVSDSELRRVLIFNPKHEVIAQIDSGLSNPGGLAVDNENRFLYIADLGLDQVLVYDADTLKLIRKIGTTGKNHYLTTPGDFSKPTGVAVDKEGNLYVADTMNDRVEIFDAEGNFIRAFGKNGDGPGYFARPKGVAIDADGHVWVADGMLDRVQVFTPEGDLLTYMGGHGNLPGQFAALCGITIDKHNRVFTSEQYPGRVQEFRYITDAEAAQEKSRRDAQLQSKVMRPEAQPSAAKGGTPAQSAVSKPQTAPPVQ